MMDLSTSGRRRVRQPVLPGIIEAALSLHAEIESDVDVDVRLVSRKKRKTPNSTFLFKHLSRNIDFAICPQTLKNSIYHYISIYISFQIFFWIQEITSDSLENSVSKIWKNTALNFSSNSLGNFDSNYSDHLSTVCNNLPNFVFRLPLKIFFHSL